MYCETCTNTNQFWHKKRRRANCSYSLKVFVCLFVRCFLGKPYLFDDIDGFVAYFFFFFYFLDPFQPTFLLRPKNIFGKNISQSHLCVESYYHHHHRHHLYTATCQFSKLTYNEKIDLLPSIECGAQWHTKQKVRVRKWMNKRQRVRSCRAVKRTITFDIK